MRGRALPKRASVVPWDDGWQERGGEIDARQADEAVHDSGDRIGRPNSSPKISATRSNFATATSPQFNAPTIPRMSARAQRAASTEVVSWSPGSKWPSRLRKAQRYET